MSKRLILSLISLGLISFLSVLIETSLNVTFKDLIKLYDTNIQKVSLLTSMFLLGITLIMPLSTYLLNKFNTKKLFIFINILFLISLLICVIFNDLNILIFARFLQGLAAGIALPLMFNIVILQAPKQYLGFLIGFCVFLVACAPGLGPIYGGFILKYFEFKDIFLFLIPFMIIAFILGIFHINNLSNNAKLNIKEYILVILLIISIILSARFIYFLPLVVIIIFLLFKAKSDILILDFKFLSGAFIVFLMQFFALSYSLILPNYLIGIINLTSFHASKVMLAGSIVAAILAPISGLLSDRFGSAKLVLLGVVFIIISNILFYNNHDDLFDLSINYLIYASGQGLAMSSIISHIIKLVNDKTNANAFINTFQQCFGVIGVIVISQVFKDSFELLVCIKVLIYLSFIMLLLFCFVFYKRNLN